MLNDSSMNIDAAIRQGFSRAATTYDDHASLQRGVVETMAEMLSPYLLPMARVLDAGCGTGYFASVSEQSDIFQLDSAFGMTQAAAENGHRTLCADIRALPFSDASFDGYISSFCLQWVEPLAEALSECQRVLKPEGIAFFSTLGPRTLRELRHAFTKAGFAAHVHDFPPSHRLDEAMERSGLRLMLFKQEIRTLHFEHPRTLLRHLKGLGATYKASGGGLHGRHYLQRLEDTLRQEWSGEIPASFEIFYYLAEKRA